MCDEILIDDIKIDNPELRKVLRSGDMADDNKFRRFVELMLFNDLAYLDDGYFELTPSWAIPNEPGIRTPEGKRYIL